jgi:hypothetical protein
VVLRLPILTEQAPPGASPYPKFRPFSLYLGLNYMAVELAPLLTVVSILPLFVWRECSPLIERQLWRMTELSSKPHGYTIVRIFLAWGLY